VTMPRRFAASCAIFARAAWSSVPDRARAPCIAQRLMKSSGRFVRSVHGRSGRVGMGHHLSPGPISSERLAALTHFEVADLEVALARLVDAERVA